MYGPRKLDLDSLVALLLSKILNGAHAQTKNSTTTCMIVNLFSLRQHAPLISLAISLHLYPSKISACFLTILSE
jgi:hypothetical protein